VWPVRIVTNAAVFNGPHLLRRDKLLEKVDGFGCGDICFPANVVHGAAGSWSIVRLPETVAGDDCMAALRSAQDRKLTEGTGNQCLSVDGRRF
jgi:hypothetical protein